MRTGPARRTCAQRAPLPLCGALLAAVVWGQAPPRRIYIAPDDHTDYMWSADEETYRQVFVETIDYYLDQADATAGNPPGQRARWNCDGNFWVHTYEKNKTQAEFARLVARIRDGTIGVPLNALASCYGGMPAEAVLRGMYYAGELERRFGLRFPVAIAMEDQTLPYGLGVLWAGAGAKYSWKGICGCATKMNTAARRPHEIYWWRGGDGSRLLMKWNTLAGNNKSLGGYAEGFDPRKSIEFVVTDPRFREWHPYTIAGIFGQGWDHLKTADDAFLRAAREMSTAGREVIVSNEQDFFEDFERTHGASLPEFNAAFGNEWDLYSASMAELSARVRRSVELLRSAEALATLVSLERPDFLDGRREARERAWMNLGLYWEHNWTNDGPTIRREARADWQRRMAAGIESYAEELFRDARYALGGMIRKEGGRPRFYVFNPLGWERTDVADVPLDGNEPAHAVDVETGAEAPSEIVTLPDANYQKGRRYLRVLASGVPPVGYKVFEVRPGEGSAAGGGPRAAGDIIENEIYRLRANGRGAIVSLEDKARGGREFVRAAGGLSVNDLGEGRGTLEVGSAGAVSATLVARADSPLEHTTRITLYRGLPRIEIRNEITRNFTGVEQWAFGFAIDRPDVWHEEVGAVIRAKLLAGGGHYSPTNSRLDWLTLNHFAAMSGPDGVGVTLSNADLAFMKLGASDIAGGVSTLDTATPQIRVLAGGQVDGPKLGVAAQGGDSYFLQRFALRTHGRFEPAEAMRFALEHQNPLSTGWVRGAGPYPPASYSLLSVGDAAVLLWALKPAEEGIGRGVIARLWNLGEQAVETPLRFARPLAGAAQASHIETDRVRLPVSGSAVRAPFAPRQMATVRLEPRGTASTSPVR